MNKLNKEVIKKEMKGLNTLGQQGRYIKKVLKSVFPNVKFSVTTRVVYGIYINYNNDSINTQDMIDTVATFIPCVNDTIYINNKRCYISDTTEYKEEQRIKYEQQQKELEVEKETRKQLYNANVKVASISNAKITNVEDKNIFVTALEPAVNKNNWKIDNDQYIDEKSYTIRYKITDIIELNKDEYNYFCFNLLQDYDFLNNKGGSCIDDNTDQLLYNYAVAVVCEDKETLIIDPQGYNYARYTCRLIEDINEQLKKNINFNIKNNYSLDNITNSIDDIFLYIYSKSKLNSRLENKIINDTRFIYNEYMGIIAITGLAYKELLKEGKCIDTNLNKVNTSINQFTENLIKMENGTCFNIFKSTNLTFKDISFTKRLQNELQRVTNTIPEPPTPTKKDSIEVPLNDTDHVENIKQNDNIINVDFTQHINKTVNATNKNTCITNNHKINNQHDWKQDQATKKQLWALHCITKLNTTNLIISKGYASNLIAKSKKENITTIIKDLLTYNDLKSKCK